MSIAKAGYLVFGAALIAALSLPGGGAGGNPLPQSAPDKGIAFISMSKVVNNHQGLLNVQEKINELLESGKADMTRIQEEMKTLRIEHFKVMNPLKNQMAELKARERTLLSGDKVDMKAVNTLIDEQTSLMNKMKKLQVEQRVKMKGILTDEQIMILDQRKPHFKRRGLTY